MSISTSISRFGDYYRRHGLAATLRRVQLATTRALRASRMVVFYCDLDERKLHPVNFPKNMKVERLRSLAELSAERMQAITSFWNAELANRKIRERFEKGASLWLLESEDQLAGYGWTLQGQTIGSYYFPLGPADVQLFDFYVFPKFRGRALHWLLTGHILHTLATEGASRAFADTHEWNKAQLASFKMTPLLPLGFVKTYKIFGRDFTCWAAPQSANQQQKSMAGRKQAMKMLRPNE